MKKRMENASVDRIREGIDCLAQFNSTPGEGVTRIALSPEDIAGRIYIKEEMQRLRLEVREDAVGNLFGTLRGTDRTLPPVWTGSHLDTVRNGGKFDGMAGVICGLEAVRMIQENGIHLKRDLTVVAFTSEEAARYGTGCIGSRALAGMLTLEDAEHIVDDQGVSLRDTLTELKYDMAAFPRIPVKKGEVHAFVELHIEQGEVLEQNEKTIGIVHTIAAPTEMHVEVLGRQDHAGATPMDLRCDAMTATAEIILKLEELARSYENRNTVGTVGKIQAYPNVSNVIPGKVAFSIDIRSSDYAEKSELLEQLYLFFKRLELNRGVLIHTNVGCDDHPAIADQGIVSMIGQTCDALGYSHMQMASGAYHDSVMVSNFAPFGMIFLPSRDGVSHDRNEWTDYGDLAKGTNVLANVLAELGEQV